MKRSAIPIANEHVARVDSCGRRRERRNGSGFNGTGPHIATFARRVCHRVPTWTTVRLGQVIQAQSHG